MVCGGGGWGEGGRGLAHLSARRCCCPAAAQLLPLVTAARGVARADPRSGRPGQQQHVCASTVRRPAASWRLPEGLKAHRAAAAAAAGAT
jgi:hypothetical protein